MDGTKQSEPDIVVGILEKSRLQITDEFTAPPVILRVNESVIGTLGNFSASTGKAKSKKTFNVCAIVASALTGGTVLNYCASLPAGKQKIIYVDTEQSRFHCLRVLRRIHLLAGLSTKAKEANFDCQEVPESNHREALENLFSEAEQVSYAHLIGKLQKGYATVGYSFGTNKAKLLKVFLENKQMIIKDGKAYRFNPNFHY